MVRNSKKDLDERQVKEILNYLGVKNENEINTMLENTWDKVECSKCGKIISVISCKWNSGDPICPDGCGR